MRSGEHAEHLNHQAARPAQKHRVLDPQCTHARCRIPRRQNPPELRSQRRRYRPFKFAANRQELTLQPGQPLGRQRSPIQLLISRLQQRPRAQQPIRLFYPIGRAYLGRLTDDDHEPPHRRGTVIARLPSAWDLWLLHAARLQPTATAGQRRTSRIDLARSRTAGPMIAWHSPQAPGSLDTCPSVSARWAVSAGQRHLRAIRGKAGDPCPCPVRRQGIHLVRQRISALTAVGGFPRGSQWPRGGCHVQQWVWARLAAGPPSRCQRAEGRALRSLRPSCRFAPAPGFLLG